MRAPWDCRLCGSGAELLAPAPRVGSGHCCQGFLGQFQRQGIALIKSCASVSIFSHVHEALTVFLVLALPGLIGSAFICFFSSPPCVHLFISPLFYSSVLSFLCTPFSHPSVYSFISLTLTEVYINE